MVITNEYYMENQPSLAYELLGSLKHLFKSFEEAKEQKQLENVKKELLSMTGRVHQMNAEIETIKDFIDNYHINDIKEDELILAEYSDLLEDLKDDVEDTLDNLENTFNIPEPMKNSLVNAYEEFYSSMINTNFAISNKITQAYLESTSDRELLQEA